MLVAVAAFGLRRIIHRHVMKTENPYSYALIENVLTALAFLPLVISEFAIPTAGIAWVLLAASSRLYIFVALTGYLSYKYTPVTLKDPISQSNMVFVLLLSAVFLSEAITAKKLIGTAAIFLGLLVLTYKKRKLFGWLSDKGVQITMLSAFLYAIVSIIDKAAMNYFTPGMYGFLVYLIPGIILLTFVQKRQK
ncbi:MAG: EamA family transporter [Candidatus Aenigmatarchaeota archaeon]